MYDFYLSYEKLKNNEWWAEGDELKYFGEYKTSIGISWEAKKHKKLFMLLMFL